MAFLQWTADKGRYAVINAVMVAACIGAVMFVPARGYVTLAFAAAWNVVSLGRTAETRLWWLHIAPYASLLGLYDLVWGFATAEGQYQSGGMTLQQAVIFYPGLLLLAAWPAATLMLILKEDTKRHPAEFSRPPRRGFKAVAKTP